MSRGSFGPTNRPAELHGPSQEQAEKAPGLGADSRLPPYGPAITRRSTLRGIVRWGDAGLVGICLGETEGAVMKLLLLWIAVALMLLGAAMLIANMGAPGLWIAVIAVGIALVAIDRVRARTAAKH
jgi:hypothetical protein